MPAVNVEGRMRYWPALDGLRGLAVIAVMLFHAQVSQVSGGFLGVDIFFVLSGFLITAQLLREVDFTGKVRFGRFFLRRTVRLQPALMLMLTIYLLGGVMGLVPGQFKVLMTDITIVLLALTHWARAFNWPGPDYLGHAWSLGIEEQFYVLWALAFFALGSSAARPSRVAALATLGVLIGMTWMGLLHEQGASVVRLYNGLDTRAMALLCGCALAGWLHTYRPQYLEPLLPEAVKPQIEPRINPATITGVVALGGLLLTMLNWEWTQSFMFPWGYMGVALLASVLIASIVQAPDNALSKLLGMSALVLTGRVSYGLYLWHYPLYRVAEVQGKAAGYSLGASMIAAAIMTFLVAWLSYRWLEQPLRAWCFSHPKVLVQVEPGSGTAC